MLWNKRDPKRIYFNEQEVISDLQQELRALKQEVWKLKYPPKYKVGDTMEDGWLVYDVEFNDQKMAGARWSYSAIKGNQRKCVDDEPRYYDYKNYI